MAFSKAQTQAIMHKDGPMMVLAGPGSGKTTVITHRVQYLTKEYGIDPGDILVITFTRAAAEEMRERYEALTGGGSRVTFGTFHSIFFRILKLAYRYTADNIVREEQQMQFVRELAQTGGLEPEDENEFAASILSEISSVKGERIALEHYYSKNCPDAVFRQLYAGYEEKMRRTGLIDFDDMMVLCLELFTERKDILSAWQRRYRYILIDEFQDINRLQYEIVRMLAKPEDNLFIVGDDDQSIYRFRGAKPEIMLGFERDYPGAGRILLDVNYRSTEEIVAPALRLIGENQKRFSKAIHTTGRHGKNVITKLWQDPGEENLAIAREIQLYLQSGVRPGDIAVLYRTNAGPRFLMEKLMEYNLPFRTRDTVPNLYEHWISRNILTYIRIAMGSRAREDILQVINRPPTRSKPIYMKVWEARKADALYILGDLFEAWIGDDDPNPLHRQMAAAIKAVSDSGVPCYFIHGNRDFLLGKRFARESGMTLLPEEKVLELYGRRVLIMHGDTLCTDDAGYQAFRAKVHKPWLQMLFLALPLFVRKRIAARMRANSKEANSSKSLAIMDVNQNAVVSAMEKHQVQWLIHGHTHRPAVHELIANQQPAFRVVLGAWHTEGSMVKVTADDVELIHFPF